MLVGLAMLAAVGYWTFTKLRKPEKPAEKWVYTPPEEKIPEPVRTDSLLKASRIIFIDKDNDIRDTLLKKERVMRISGDFFFVIKKEDTPLHLRTRLIDVHVDEPSEFRVSAYDADRGESIEVMSGYLRVAKTYTSPWPEPDTLRDSSLYMINDSIDLSEKEKLDNIALKKWWERVKRKFEL
ncbi:hypothetical protein SAMN05216436_102156 [bacterium A37T11]|nr:hypothetical protein SAMN05216436_102156 [bacterium A37T11]